MNAYIFTNNELPLLTLAQLNFLINTLEELISYVNVHGTAPSPTTGICFNWDSVIHERNFHIVDNIAPPYAYTLVAAIATNWEGNRFPGQQNVDPIPQHYGFSNWDGPNLVQRKSLMNFIHTHLCEQRRSIIG